MHNLIFFAQFHKYSVQNIKTYCSLNDSFLFACVVISTLFWLKHFFHLDGGELTLLKGVDAVKSSRKGLKFFLSFRCGEASKNSYDGREIESKSAQSDANWNPSNGREESNEDAEEGEYRRICEGLFANDSK